MLMRQARIDNRMTRIFARDHSISKTDARVAVWNVRRYGKLHEAKSDVTVRADRVRCAARQLNARYRTW